MLSLGPSGQCHSEPVKLCIFFVVIFNVIYLFLAVLGLRCFVPAFSSCLELGLLFVVMFGLLIAVASLVADLGL